MSMIPCIIESPYKGDVARNKIYLDRCIRHCIEKGYTPYASHKMVPGALDDLIPVERELGIKAGLEMADFILDSHSDSCVFFFVDYGSSDGMSNYAWPHHHRKDRRIYEVMIGENL